MKLLIFLAFCVGSLYGQGCSPTTSCFPTASIQYATKNRKLAVNDLPLVLKGISYFGFETDTFAPHGIWTYSLDFFLDTIKNNSFNAIRVPFSLRLVRDNPTNPNVNCGTNSAICNLDALDLLEAFVDKAADRGLLVMVDNHVPYENGPMTELWFDNDQWTEANVISTWQTLLGRIGDRWNVFAIDLKNEPHGAASWGWEQNATDWDLAAARFINALSPSFDGLFFVEGVGENAASPFSPQYGHFWGENLEGVWWHQVNTGDAALNKRIVYSPHVYGPSVFNQSYFSAGNFPANMPAIWKQHFGYAVFSEQPVVVGEWGGRYLEGTSDETWQNALAAYLIDNCLTDNFYWCLNPNSGDTGGLLLDDWQTVDTRKAALLAGINPNPTSFSTNGTHVCVTPGTYVSPFC